MADCTYDAQNILDNFKDRIFYLWFDNLDDAIILSVIEDILDCPPSRHIWDKCRNIFCCWIYREIALCLFAYGIGDDGAGNPTVPDLTDDPVVSYVKRDKVRDEEREYFKPELPPCTNCEDFPLGKIKAQAKKYMDMCTGSRRLLGGVGTDYGCRTDCKPSCEKDSYRGS